MTQQTSAAGAPSTPPAGRERLIRAAGDGPNVYRVAERHNATAAVYVAPAAGERADVDAHPSLTLTVTDEGAWTLAHELGGWGQVPPAVLASGHIDQVPTVAPRPDGTRFVWVLDGEIHKGTAGALASWAAAERMGYADDPVPAFVYAPTTAGGLVPVPVRVECSPYDTDGRATVTATVELSPGVVVTGYGQVDGAA